MLNKQKNNNRLICEGCDIDFESKYGELGIRAVEVHHIKPLSSTDGEQMTNPEKDLVCLCGSCHNVIHKRRNEVLSLEELRNIVNRRK